MVSDDAASERADDLLATAAAWRDAGRSVALATVVRTWGSSPRQPGSRLVVAADGAFTGSVSGGCVEGAVVEEALGVLTTGRPKLLHFGVSEEQAWAVGLACGGQVEIWVEPLPAVLDELLAARREKRPVVLATPLDGGPHALLEADADDAAREVLARDEARVVERDGRTVFLEPHNPPLRLVIVGAVHIARPLSRLAAIAGFEVVVIDPRRAFTLPDVTRSTRWPDEALAEIRPDTRTAVVTLTHDPKLDDPALAAALATPAFFLGCLGSKKTHAARLARLAAAGFEESDLARLHGPVGLPIGARTPEEIAVSILAQVIAALHDGGRRTDG
jgi:xanthine dehydrogenase accessory factor